MKNKIGIRIFCLVIFLLFATFTAQSATRVVTKVADTNDFNCNADCSLREAIAVAQSGDLIIFSGLFNSPQTITLTGFFYKRLDVTQSVTIQGPGANLLTINGNNGDRVFEIFSGTNTTISGMRITGGNPQTINFGSNGGGFIIKSGSTLTLNNVLVDANSAYDGGGIYIENSSVLNINDSTVSGNSCSQLGGGIANDFGTLNAQNVTISGNSTGNAFGGIYNSFGGVNLNHVTITANASTGIQNFSGNVNVHNSIIAGNGADVDGSFNSQGYNLVQNTSGSLGFGVTGDILGQSPQLGALQNNGGATPTHKPACSSPTVDAGNPYGIISTDQRGFPRPVGYRVDIGAVETGCVYIVSNNNDTSTGSLRDAISNVESGGNIVFDPTFFSVPRTITLNSVIIINKNISLTGVGFITLRGGSFVQIFNVQSSGTLNLKSLNLVNGVTTFGGAINNAGTTHLNDVSFSENRAVDGSAIHNTGTLTMTNSTLSGNFHIGSGTKGGGIFNAGTLSIVNSTITNNVAESGGGIYADSGTVNVANSIIGGNISLISFPDARGSFNSQGSNLITNTDGSTGFGTSGDILGQSPQLGVFQYNGGLTLTHLPTANSPVINAGNQSLAINPINNQPLTVDQTGFNRNFVGVDIGSTEFKQPFVNNANNSGSGSLRLAVADAQAGSSILFSTNFFNQPRTILLTSGELVINKNLTINAPTGLTIDANSNSRIFNILAGATLNLDGLTLVRGNVIGAGGAILNFGTLNLNNSTITGNQSTTGGGIANGEILNITNSTIFGNTASDSGGISNGGNNGTVTITNSTISGNTATSGDGGGIKNYIGIVNLNHVTIAFNTATGAGGGIINQSLPGTFIRPRNTLIAYNTAGIVGNDIVNSIDSQGYNLVRILNVGDGGGFGATDIVGNSSNPVNAGLRPLSLNGGTTLTHGLQSGNLAVNNGDPNNLLATDQRGISRPRYGRVDIGAVESSSIVTNADANSAESLRSILSSAADGETITFDPSFFNVPRTINLAGTGELSINKALTIQGPGANLLTISGGNQSRIFGIAPSLTSVTINDLTITQGGNVPNGGAIFNSSLLNLNNVVLTGNASSSTGGAIYNNYQIINLNNCTFSNNTSLSRGGGAIFSENFGSQSPGTSVLNIRNSTFSGNQAISGIGGGVFNNLGTTRVSNSTFSGNSANEGSAVYHAGGSPLRIVNSTITLNNNSNGGRAVIADSNLNNNVVNNSIVAGNIGGDIFGLVGSNNLIGNGDFSNFVNGTNGNIVGTELAPINPNLTPLGNFGGATNTHALFSYSLAKNAGDNALAIDPVTNQPLTTDQRGVLRIIEGFTSEGRNLVPIVDIGSFEFQAPTSASVSVSGKVLTSKGRGIRNVQVTLTDSNGNTQTTTTSSFGIYRFDELRVGENYVLQVNAKRFLFQNPSRIINLTEELTGVDFIAN